MELLQQLKENYLYSDYYIPYPPYNELLQRLWTEPLTQELVDYLCMQIDNPKSKRSCELRFIHLQPLYLNPTATNFDLKDYLHTHIKRSRRLWLKMFFIRAFVPFAEERECIPLMKSFSDSLIKIHDYQDYDQILSAAGLPYLVKRYGYACFRDTLELAKIEYEKIDPLLRGHFTLDEDGELINLLSHAESKKRMDLYLKKIEKTDTD